MALADNSKIDDRPTFIIQTSCKKILTIDATRPHAKFRRRTSRRFRGDSEQTLKRLSIIIY